MRFALISLIMMPVLSCSSMNEYSHAHPSLFIGMIDQRGSLGEEDPFSIKGPFKYEEVLIVFQNTETKEKYNLIPNVDGFFFSTNIPSGIYTLKNTSIRLVKNGSKIVQHTSSQKEKHYFEVHENMVNNFGGIIWETSDDPEKDTYLLGSNYYLVYLYFLKHYSGSGWLNKEWINTICSHERKL